MAIKLRKNYGADYSLFNDINWSCWTTIMSPSAILPNNLQLEKRGFSKGLPLAGYRLNNKSFKTLIPSNSGIYELGLSRPGTVPLVVYVGKTKSLQKRILLYCYDGSHKRDILDNCLRKGCLINVRFYSTTSFDFWEWKILGHYRYHSNIQIPRRLPTRRRDITGRFDPSHPFPPINEPDEDDCKIQELLAEDIETPGPYVPAYNLVLRNSVADSHPLFDDWSGKWSNWITIISPFNVNLPTRNGSGSRLSSKKLKFDLDPYNKGIYELSTCPPSSNPNLALPSAFVFYVGAANANTGEALYDRINQICANGMHSALGTYINQAVSAGSCIQARVMGTHDHDLMGNLLLTAPYVAKIRVLTCYDYQKNKRCSSNQQLLGY